MTTYGATSDGNAAIMTTLGFMRNLRDIRGLRILWSWQAGNRQTDDNKPSHWETTPNFNCRKNPDNLRLKKEFDGTTRKSAEKYAHK